MSVRMLGVLLLVTFVSATAGLAQDKIRVGVWNIEKLSATATRGFPELQGSQFLGPRTPSDLDAIAAYIQDELEVDVLMVTEIEGDAPESTPRVPQSAQLNHIAQRMGSNWRYFLGRTGEKLRLGLLFNTDRIRLKKLVNLHASKFHVTGRDVLARDPFIAWITVVDDAGQAKNDVLPVCVHLKSIQGRFRHNRMAAMAKLIGDITDARTRATIGLPSKNEERETMILGDCNDSGFGNPGFKYIFDYLAGTGFTHLKPNDGTYSDTRVNGSKIDHIFATRKIVVETMVPGSFRVHAVPESEREDYRRTFSDHFPVTVDLRVRPDDDLTLHEALLVADQAERGALLAGLTDEIDRLDRDIHSTTDDEEEEEDEPPVVEFEMIDSDFDRILAPQPQRFRDEMADSGAPATRRMLGDETPSATDSVSSDAAIWTAIDLIQKRISSFLTSDDGLSPQDLTRVRQLLQAERELLRLVRE